MKHPLLRRPTWLTTSALAFILTALLIGFATVALAASPAPAGSPGPTGSGAATGGALPGDPTKGQAIFNGAGGCAACHGTQLEGGIGARLKPLENLGNTPTPTDPTYLITTITKGLQGAGKYTAAMPPFGGTLSAQDIKDLAAYIILAQQAKGPAALTPDELANSNVTWVTIGVLVMITLTWLLAKYNMRWIARKVAARRSGGPV